MDKLVGSIPSLLGSSLGNGFCALEEQKPVDLGILGFVRVCEQSSAACSGNKGCSAYVYLNTTDLPANQRIAPNPMPPPPGGRPQDNKLGFTVTLRDGATPGPPRPVVHVDGKIDALVPIRVDGTVVGINVGSCWMYVHTSHVASNANNPLNLLADIEIGVDPVKGGLTLNLASFDIPNIGDINIDSNGGVCDLGSYLGDVLDLLGSLPSFIRTFILNLLRPTINNLIQGFLPDPLGLAGTFDSGSLLRAFNPPKDTNLEMFVVPGGYVQAKSGGLTLGVMGGFNSDRDQTTRGPGLSSEPSLCVPVRPTPALGAAPWNLPFNAARNDYTLNPAGPFAGNPEPVNPMGGLQDVAIGVSRTYMDLAGFHLINSGTLCLAIGGEVLPQLNAGTLSVIVGSLGNILDNKKAPLALVLRPQQPLTFTIGEGSMMDPLIHLGVADMRIDFYGFVEERYVRLLTMGLDMNAGLNLTVVKGSDGKPALQPELIGVDSKNVTIRISNTDLLQEKPKDLEAVFPTLINIATGALGGAIKPVSLPSLAGFSLDDLRLGRVQTTQDDFLGIFATIKTGTPQGLMDWSDPAHPKVVGELRTKAVIESVNVPPPESLKALFAERGPLVVANAARPTVVLNLDAEGNYGKDIEFAWRIDGGMWRPWTRERHLTLADDMFLLQGKHSIEVRARVVNEWTTMDQSPVKLDVIIDSMAPEIHPQRNPQNPQQLLLGGFDIVSDDAALQYAWLDRSGKQTAWTSDDFITVEAARLITDDGVSRFTIFVKDEAGNIGQSAVDLSALLGFHGRTTAPAESGCGCQIGAASTGSGTGGVLAFVLGLLVLLWRRRQGQATAKIGALVAALALYASGCGCENKGLQCQIDDDCLKMQCATGQIPVCQSNMCICNPDLPPGETGAYASMALRGPDAYVAAYNRSYGDLMIGHITPPGIVTNWDFVDGVPDEAPSVPLSHVRGGIESKGDDVGRYTSIQINKDNDPVIAYYDKTHGTLKFAHFGVIRWRSHTVDKGTGTPATGDDIGRWASLSIGSDGRPTIAYTATLKTGMSGKPEGQLRVAQAKVNNPTMPSDWTVTIVDSRALPDPNDPTGSLGDMGSGSSADGGTPPPDPLYPEVIGLMPQIARKMDGSPGIVYYDRPRGNLRYVEFSTSMAKWSTPVILDGEDAMGNDTADVGMFPSLTYDDKDVAHISYVDSTRDNLLYVNSATKTPEVADDGYRPMEEMTLDGIPSPVFHLVGDGSSIQVVNDQVVIAYQDSTTVQLRLAQRAPSDGKWTLSTIAGHASPFKGSYGFYANLRVSSKRGIISTYAINQQLDNPLYFVEVFSIDLGFIM